MISDKSKMYPGATYVWAHIDRYGRVKSLHKTEEQARGAQLQFQCSAIGGGYTIEDACTMVVAYELNGPL